MNLKKIFRRTTTILLIILSLFFAITCHVENPNNVVAYNNRGINYFEQNQYERAMQDFNKAIQFNSNHSNAHNNRGIAYMLAGNEKKLILLSQKQKNSDILIKFQRYI